MAGLHLPEAAPGAQTALLDAGKATAWLAAQPQGQALRFVRALLTEVRGIDAQVSDPAGRLEILDTLRPAVIQAESSNEIRFASRPLPLLRDEAAAFAVSWELWWHLAVAYLRVVPLLPASALAQPLHRAAIALREVLRCHYLAGVEAPPAVLALLYQILTTAEARQVLRQPVTDPHLAHLGESSVAGEIAWALLLHVVDPYRFSAGQLAVAHRAFSRWRELAGFQATANTGDEKEIVLPLERWIDRDCMDATGLAWLEVRAVRRKLRKRIDALREGETPDQLRLGRELSPAACLDFLQDLYRALRHGGAGRQEYLQPETPGVDLVSGFENLYTLLAGKPLNETELTLKSGRNSHDRIAVFGFDNVANRVDHAGDQRVPADSWAVEDDWVLRAANAGAQMNSGVLLGIRSDKPALTVLEGVRQTVDGWLAGHLRKLPGVLGCGVLRTGALGAGANRQPVFFLQPEAGANQATVILPSGIGMREGLKLALEESPVEHLLLGAVLERGSNYLRMAYTRC